MDPISFGSAAWRLVRRFWYVIPILGLVIALLITRSTLAGRTVERDNAIAFNNQVTEATRQAARNPRLAQRDVPAQILALGGSVRALGDGLDRCNASARAAADNDARRQAAAQEALRAARAAAVAQTGLVARLRASAAATRPGAANCEPSETIREIWR